MRRHGSSLELDCVGLHALLSQQSIDTRQLCKKARKKARNNTDNKYFVLLQVTTWCCQASSRHGHTYLLLLAGVCAGCGDVLAGLVAASIVAATTGVTG